MPFVKIEDSIVTQKQPNEQEGFVEVNDKIHCGMIHDGTNKFNLVNFSLPEIIPTPKTWGDVKVIQSDMIDCIMRRVERYITQRDLPTGTTETEFKYKEILQYIEDVRLNDDGMHDTPDEAIAALEALTTP